MRTCHVDPSSPPSPPCPSRSAPRYSAPAAPRRHHRRRTARPRGTPKAIDGRLDSKLAQRPGQGAAGTVTAFVQLDAKSGSDVDGRRRHPRRGQGRGRGHRGARRRGRPAAGRPPARPRSAAPKQIATLTNLVAGTLVTGDAAQVRALADVARRRRRLPGDPEDRRRTRTTSSSRARSQVWQDTGQTGEGVRIGVIDTGLDYTHADFGGPGTVEAYERGLRRGRHRPDPGRPRSTRPSSSAATTSPAPLYDASDDLEGATPSRRPTRTRSTRTYLSDNGGHGTHVVRHRRRLRRPARRHHVPTATTAASTDVVRLAGRPRHRARRRALRAQGVRRHRRLDQPDVARPRPRRRPERRTAT